MGLLKTIKEMVETNRRFSNSQLIIINFTDVEWLIEQAEQLQKIKMLSNAEGLTLSDFGLDVLSIIENREIPTRKRMS